MQDPQSILEHGLMRTLRLTDLMYYIGTCFNGADVADVSTSPSPAAGPGLGRS